MHNQELSKRDKSWNYKWIRQLYDRHFKRWKYQDDNIALSQREVTRKWLQESISTYQYMKVQASYCFLYRVR